MPIPTVHLDTSSYRRLVEELTRAETGVLLVSGPAVAARVAGDVGRSVYRIDLSTVVSKYIGETEKNLEQALASPGARGAALLFEEADAVFGRRREAEEQDYASPEIGWLLERVAGIRALALFATERPRRLVKALRRRAAAFVEGG